MSEASAGTSGLWGRSATRLARRRAFRWAALVLVGAATIAVYAPFLASDRPLFLEAVHRGAFERALRTLVPVTRSLSELLALDEAAFRATREPGAEQSLGAARAAEAEALRARLAELERSLPAEGRAAVRALEREGAELAASAGAHASVPQAACTELVERARALDAALDPARVALVPVRSWPLVAALTPLDLGLAVGWPLVLAATLVLLRDPRRARAFLGGALVLALGAALTWRATVGAGDVFHTSNHKTELTSGALEARHVVFAPVPYGYAEQHSEEGLRPPTWLAASELDARGAYVRGARVPVPDRVTGFVPASRPVEVRAGEPGLNSPWRHVLGTDRTGRDLLARLIHGARASLTVGFLAALLLCGIGVTVGALAGTFGGLVDLALSRLIEVVSSIPLLFLVLVAVALLGPSLWNVILVLGCVGWTGVARLARTEFQRERGLDYLSAARALGFSWPRILGLHVLPNTLAPLLVAGTFAVASAILVESALSFLGFGVEVPVASWGGLTSESRDPANWWLQVFPGVCLLATVLAVQLVGDALRDALDPRAAERAPEGPGSGVEPGRAGA